jgi:hypothetical protein
MNLSVLIHTFNGYQHLWPGFLEAWKMHWQSRWVHPFFGTDVISPAVVENRIGDRFFMLYSGPGEWSDRLARLLEDIPTDYILYMQEDQWPTQSPPDLAEMMDIMREKDLFRLQISPIVPFYKLFSVENMLFFDLKSKYLVSHQPSIWKKSFLLDCLKPNETPWQNEYSGTMRLNHQPNLYKKIAIYPHDWYKHMCIKGKMVES